MWNLNGIHDVKAQFTNPLNHKPYTNLVTARRQSHPFYYKGGGLIHSQGKGFFLAHFRERDILLIDAKKAVFLRNLLAIYDYRKELFSIS
jgi:hypothetical protein